MTTPAASSAAPRPAAAPTSDDMAARAWQAMRTLVLDRYDRRKKVCDALGMSFIRAKALRQVAAGPMTMRELAAGLGTDPPYTTVAVDDLERRGLVVRTVCAGDRRSKLVSITPAGLEQARLADEILSAPPRPVRELPADDLAALDRILRQLAASG
ncbi:MAG TPA: MarR family transcriptional regulator [Streptosporangiaceae bacterium]|nr:MarR family transcriptional regulator [Streptosporangiaceae bacterium]